MSAAADLPPLSDDEAARIGRLAAVLDARRNVAVPAEEPSPDVARDAA